MKLKRPLRDYHEQHIQDLKEDPELAICYLQEALKDEDPRIFLNALQNVKEANNKALEMRYPAYVSTSKRCSKKF